MFAASQGSGSASAGAFATSTWTGNATARSITNNIDLKDGGGLVWFKNKSDAAYNYLADTERGKRYALTIGQDFEQTDFDSKLTSFDATGFSISTNSLLNATDKNFASWTFRKKRGFFDVQKFANTGSGAVTINHSLGVKPGLIILGRRGTDRSSSVVVWHKDLDANKAVDLVYDIPARSFSNFQFITDTSFQYIGDLNVANFVTYIFADDTTANGSIRCGKYTGNGSATGPTITLGWQPQFLMVKCSTNYGQWVIVDSMRGFKAGNDAIALGPKSSAGEVLTPAETSADYFDPSPTGFSVTSTSSNVNANKETYIYMAVRA